MLMLNVNYGKPANLKDKKFRLPPMKKKGQMKIQQMAFMLIAVTLFFVLAGMFFLVIYMSELKGSVTLLEEKNAITLAMKIANSPEFSCGNAFGGTKLKCVDGDKVMMLKKNINKYWISKSRNESFWGNEVNIEIKKIFPQSEKRDCTTENYPNCDTINLFGVPISSEYSNFILLCRKQSFGEGVYNKCEIAKLMVNYKKWDK